MSDSSLSRRQLFPALFAGAATAAALSLGLSESAQAQPKVSQAIAKYQDHPNGDNKCSLCQFFQGPSSCQLVEGTISADGWCSFFSKKT